MSDQCQDSLTVIYLDTRQTTVDYFITDFTNAVQLAYSAPPDPLAGLRGLLLRGEGRAGEGREGRGGEGRAGEGRGEEGTGASTN